MTMNNRAKDITEIENDEQSEVFGLLSEHLDVVSPSQTLLDSVALRLENRIQTSITKHAGLRTVRSKDGVWHNLVSGIRYKSLWQGPQGNSVLVEFSPGSALPLHRHSYLEEGIVLSGSLQLDDIQLTQFDYHVSPAGSHHGRIQSDQGALAYLRGSSLGQPLSMLKEVLAGLLPKTHLKSESIIDDEDGWIEVQKGVFQKDLWTDSSVASRFFRLAAGTHLDGHYHPLDEECMMLGGEVFLGDILLQAGDYHIAPASTEHLEVFSDTGGLLFVRGAI
jgi:quercetin dioxygenase-like cupin family protein